VARLLRGQRSELAVGVMAHLRALSSDGRPRVYQARLPEKVYLTVADVHGPKGRMLVFQRRVPLSPYRTVAAVIGRPRGAPQDGGWFVGLTPAQHRSALATISAALTRTGGDYEPLAGATSFDPAAPVEDPASAHGPDLALDAVAVQEAHASDAPVPGADPSLVTVSTAAAAFAAAMLATLAGVWGSASSAELLSAGVVFALLFGAVAMISSIVACAMGPEEGWARPGAIGLALLGGIGVLSAALQLLSSTPGSVVSWALAAVMYLIAWGQATGAYGVWWLAPALPIVGGAVGAPVGAAIDGAEPGWGYVLGAALVLAGAGLAFLALVRSPTLIPHRRIALAELRRLTRPAASAADADGAPTAPTAR